MREKVGAVSELRFTPRNRPDLEIIVDAEDLHLIVNLVWTAHRPSGSRTHYAQARVGGRAVSLHRRIMGCVPGDGVELNHADGDGLNCRRENLERVTHGENVRHGRLLVRNYEGCRTYPRDLVGPGEKAVRKLMRDGRVRVYVYDRATKDRVRSFVDEAD